VAKLRPIEELGIRRGEDHIKVSDDIRKLFAQLIFGRDPIDGECVSCRAMVEDQGFRDEASRREYAQSYLCQACQDTVFTDGR
jgi:hypothetical protein